jgi:hypothetical protein
LLTGEESFILLHSTRTELRSLTQFRRPFPFYPLFCQQTKTRNQSSLLEIFFSTFPRLPNPTSSNESKSHRWSKRSSTIPVMTFSLSGIKEIWSINTGTSSVSAQIRMISSFIERRNSDMFYVWTSTQLKLRENNFARSNQRIVADYFKPFIRRILSSRFIVEWRESLENVTTK